MTKYLGLTPAMRRALETGDWGSMRLPAKNAGFITLTDGTWDTIEVTTRGSAALAAPKMTQAEFDMLRQAELFGFTSPYGSGWKIDDALNQRGFLNDRKITPAGRAALNNIRAAIGSPDYKETPDHIPK